MSIETEILVAGGGPVGLAAAIEARLAGLDVVVVEPRVGPIDKACGEGLMPGAVPALTRLGVHPRGFPLRGVEYIDTDGRTASHRFITGNGLGVRRTVLHQALHARAEDLGARFVVDHVNGVIQDATGVTAGGIRADWLIAADGLTSRIARDLGMALPTPRTRRRYGQRRHYRVEQWTDLIEVHWSSLGEMYVTPSADGLVNIALLAAPGVHFDEALALTPQLAERVRRAPAASQLRGAGPLRHRTRRRVLGRTLLVGDASGYVDALTGEGIRIGLDQASAAITAVAAGHPQLYEADWKRITRDFRRLTGAITWAATSPLRSLIVPTARTAPGVFESAVERLAR
ncbi:MAG TPA: NAD(P)/FAD-dependent oxidoreductase [Pseudolysinimonas sp.]|nr:NAD(P)/FAD-dependent oxidoreductase [Pseudolysinimonas sp.]